MTHPTYALAADLLAFLSPACQRLEIAGSIRRGKPEPKDIELVAISQVGAPALDLFGAPVGEIESPLEARVAELIAAGSWDFDTATKRNGPRYKRLRHIDSGVCCDLFITTPECWGVIFAIRTGPGDYSRELVTAAKRLGYQVEDGRLWRLHRDGARDVVPTPEEADFFRALGVPMPAPAERRYFR